MIQTETLDLDQRVVDYIKAHVNLPSEVSVGRQDSSGPGIAYIMTPTNEVKHFYNGRVRRSYAFSIMTKLPRPVDAIGLLNRAISVIEQAQRQDIVSSNGTFEFVKAEMTDSPGYRSAVEDAGKTYSIYAASFKTTIVIN